MKILMHYNPALPHQLRHAEAFKKTGVKVTPSPHGEADVHIISGPWFAYKQWLGHPRVIMIDRAYWGDPEYVSIGWLRPDGSREFALRDKERFRPWTFPWKTREDSALILADYGQDVDLLQSEALGRFGNVSVRRHPAEEKHALTLDACLMLTDVVIGNHSTALVDAIVWGRPVICFDTQAAVAPVAVHDMSAELYRGDREEWLHRLSWAQFNHDEFGLALEALNARGKT